METIKSFTDLEQSKKLAEVLPLESVDMCYRIVAYNPDDTHVYQPYCFVGTLESDVPCWSLAALIGVLPQKLIYDATEYTLEIYKNPDKSYEIGYLYKVWAHVASNNKELVDACVEMIIKLKEKGLL